MRDWFLLVPIIALSLISTLVLKSVAPALATQQVLFFLFGFTVMTVIASKPITFWRHFTLWWYGGLLILLCFPLLLGSTNRGISAWIEVGGWFSIQPSQLAIPLVSLMLGCSVTTPTQLSWQKLGQLLGIIGVPAGLILLEPDLGTTIIFLVTSVSIVFLLGMRWHQVATLGFFTLLAAALAWAFVLAPYQKARITSFLGSKADPAGANYNALQALIAVGSGQYWGRGLGQGVQSHLRFLPERQTDFIFASLAEELGFAGSLLVIGLYTSLITFCLWLSWQARSPLTLVIPISAGIMTGVQATINIGMNMGVFPITGITLPLLSYGGSSIVGVCVMYGLVWSVYKGSVAQPHLTSRSIQ